MAGCIQSRLFGSQNGRGACREVGSRMHTCLRFQPHAKSDASPLAAERVGGDSPEDAVPEPRSRDERMVADDHAVAGGCFRRRGASLLASKRNSFTLLIARSALPRSPGTAGTCSAKPWLCNAPSFGHRMHRILKICW